MDKQKFNSKVLGNSIQAARGHAKLKREELAGMVDISLRTMASIESGDSDISVKKLYEISEALTTPVAKLLGLEDIAISNSFNNIQEGANVQGINNRHKIEVDRAWQDEVNKRFAFLESLITSLRAENTALRQRLGEN